MRYLAVLCGLLLIGCAGSYRTVQPSDQNWQTDAIVKRYLERDNWESLACRFKLTYEAGDSAASAKGMLHYVSPENYQLSFVRPYNRVLGDLYLTATQTIYWGGSYTRNYSPNDDTVFVSELLPFELPEWMVRDLMPFPIAGRTAGLQVLKTEVDSLGRSWIQGVCGGANHDLLFDLERGTIELEFVRRNDGDYVRKHYLKTYDLDGHPVPGRIVIEDLSQEHVLTWQLYDIDLSVAPLSISN